MLCVFEFVDVMRVMLFLRFYLFFLVQYMCCDVCCLVFDFSSFVKFELFVCLVIV